MSVSQSQPGPANQAQGWAKRGVIAVLAHEGRFLMIQRAAGVVMPGYWCFPGGHVEAGETPCRAVQREMLEELGVVVKPTQRLGAIRIRGGAYVLAVWCVAWDGQPFAPSPAEIADYRWVTQDEITSIDPGLASNGDVVELLR